MLKKLKFSEKVFNVGLFWMIICRFMCFLDFFINFSVEFCMKVGLDLSVKYLVFFDIKR